MYVDYDWIQPSSDDMQFVEKFFSEVFVNEEDRRNIGKMLFNCVAGIKSDRIFIATGTSPGGKTTVFDYIMESVFRGSGFTYSIPGYMNFLSKRTIPRGTCHELAELDKKRLVLFPYTNRKIQSVVPNILTGPGPVYARGLYSHTREITIMGTFVAICEELPPIDKDLRFVEIKFNSYFGPPSESEKKRYPKELVFEKIHEYSTREFWNRYSCAVIEHLKRYR